jgi:succinate dehydrogenase/fumarate reductase cytochrome b subunit
MPTSAQEQILNKQRIHRPSSPHFTIYQPQLTWIGSIANRVTGVGFSVCELITRVLFFGRITLTRAVILQCYMGSPSPT